MVVNIHHKDAADAKFALFYYETSLWWAGYLPDRSARTGIRGRKSLMPSGTHVFPQIIGNHIKTRDRHQDNTGGKQQAKTQTDRHG